MHAQTLHIQLGWNQISIHSLTLRKDILDFILIGKLFHIFGPKDLKLLSSYLEVLKRLSIVSFGLSIVSIGLTLEFTFDLKYIFHIVRIYIIQLHYKNTNI